MTHPTRGIARDKSYHVKANENISYGFKAKDENAIGISESDLTSQLGWTTFSTSAESTAIALVVFGANVPKPPRVTKKLAGGRSFSGFCAYDKLRAALNNFGWSFSKQGKPTASGGGKIKRLVAVALTNPSSQAGSTLYGFLLRRDDIAAYPDLIAELARDLTLGDGAIKKMVIDTSRPRPRRAKVNITAECGPTAANAATDATFSAFYDPSKEDTLFTVDSSGNMKWRQVAPPRSF